MNSKLEEILSTLEELADELNHEDDEQAKQVSLILQILCSSIYIDQEYYVHRFILTKKKNLSN